MKATEPPPGTSPGGRFDGWFRRRPRYIVADVDGTLLGRDQRASDEVAAAVTAAANANVAVGFATGRMRLAVESLWDQLRAPGPHILHNGAEVRAETRTIATWPLQPAHLDAVFDIVTRLEAYAEIYVEQGYYVTSRPEPARQHWAMLGRDPLGTVSSAAEVDGPVPKVTFAVFGGADPEPIVGALQEAGLAAGPAHSPATPEFTYINGTHPDADKGVALAAAARHLGVELADTAAIGDSYNDLPMLERAGTAVAMGQAPEQVLAAAHLIVPDVAAHGAAVALQSLIGLSTATTSNRAERPTEDAR